MDDGFRLFKAEVKEGCRIQIDKNSRSLHGIVVGDWVLVKIVAVEKGERDER